METPQRVNINYTTHLITQDTINYVTDTEKDARQLVYKTFLHRQNIWQRQSDYVHLRNITFHEYNMNCANPSAQGTPL